jgi:hypothetical protein
MKTFRVCISAMVLVSSTTGCGGGSAGRGDGGIDSSRPLPHVIDAGPLAETCGLEHPAFCETFETPAPGGRGGDLDEHRWAFARWGHEWQYMWTRVPASARNDVLFPPTFCGATFSGILPNEDVRACMGQGVGGIVSHQLNEVFDDQGDFGINSMRVRQLFDFADREGRIVWDVDAKYNPHNLGHGWWIEVWITEDPAPIPYHEAPTVASFPRNGVGFAFRFGDGCRDDVDAWSNALESVHVTHDYDIVHAYGNNDFEYDSPWPSADRCFRVADGRLNHFELRITEDRAELWASDFDDPTPRLRVTVPNLDLTFDRGYVHFQHAHYNAIKDGPPVGSNCSEPNCPTPTQTYRWDNIGFDGPTYARPRSYEVPDNEAPSGTRGGIALGYSLENWQIHSFVLPGVDLASALSATFNFTHMEAPGQSIELRFNGGPWHTRIVPNPGPSNTALRSVTLDVPLSELVSGSNTIEVRAPGADYIEGIGNMDLTIEAGQ